MKKYILLSITAALFVIGCAATVTIPKGTIIPAGSILPGTTQPTTQATVAPATEQVIEPTTPSTAVAKDLGTAQTTVTAVAPFLNFIPGWGTVASGVALALAAGLGVGRKLASGETVPQAIEDTVQGAESAATALVPLVAPNAAATVASVETVVNAVTPAVAAVAAAVVAKQQTIATAQGPVAVTTSPVNAS